MKLKKYSWNKHTALLTDKKTEVMFNGLNAEILVVAVSGALVPMRLLAFPCRQTNPVALDSDLADVRSTQLSP
jgi:hypothetical protein